MEKASVSASYETRCLNDYGPLMLMKFVKNHLLRFGQSQLSSVQFSFRCDRKFSQNGGEIAVSHSVCVGVHTHLPLFILNAILWHRHVVPPQPVPTIPHMAHTARHFPAM